MDHEARQVIRARLKEKGWDQTELARRLGLSGPTVSRVLSGPLMRPESHWPAVLDALGLELAVLPRRRPGLNDQRLQREHPEQADAPEEHGT